MNNKKITCIPPLINKNKTVAAFKGKSEFNLFLAKHVPLLKMELPYVLNFCVIDKSLNNIFFSEEDILTTIRRLDLSKVHDHDQISIGMIQLCDKSLLKPRYLYLSLYMKSGIFPTEYNMADVVPIYKRDDKQSVKHYRPVSLLSKFGKIFAYLVVIFNNMYPTF